MVRVMAKGKTKSKAMIFWVAAVWFMVDAANRVPKMKWMKPRARTLWAVEPRVGFTRP